MSNTADRRQQNFQSYHRKLWKYISIVYMINLITNLVTVEENNLLKLKAIFTNLKLRSICYVTCLYCAICNLNKLRLFMVASHCFFKMDAKNNEKNFSFWKTEREAENKYVKRTPMYPATSSSLSLLQRTNAYSASTGGHFLIHSANPKSRPIGIIVFSHVFRPSVPTFQI